MLFVLLVNRMRDTWVVFYVVTMYTLVVSGNRIIVVDGTNGVDEISCYSKDGGSCKTLDYALTNGLRSDTTIVLHQGNYSSTTNHSTFHDLHDIGITGAGRELTSISTGLSFINTTNLLLANFSLFGGGKLMESTSINHTSQNIDKKMALFRVALYLWNCSDVVMDGLVVTNSSGTGVAMFNVTGNVLVHNSIFSHNKVLKHEVDLYPGGGGIYIEFFCKVARSISYKFTGCEFTGNNATSVKSVLAMLSSFRQHASRSVHKFGSGGGLSIDVWNSTSNSIFSIQNCSFNNNSAVWGGALHFIVLNRSPNTQFIVKVKDTNFTSNECLYTATRMSTGTGGGGIRFLLWPKSKIQFNTTLQLINCKFYKNYAYYGGGVSISMIRERETSHSSVNITFEDCHWDNNSARTGSAMDIYANDFPTGMLPTVQIIDCSFTQNSNQFTLNSKELLGLGAFYTRSVPIQFQGNIKFLSNYGSAIAGTATRFIFCENSSVTFFNNSGRQGGAIALLGVSYMELHDYVSLNFSNNRAIAKGGAIYSLVTSERDFINSQNCFIFYKNLNIHPSNWTAKLTFAANSAPHGNSIYCTTLLPCVWSDQPGGIIATEKEINEVFYWNGTFTYTNITNLTTEIRTAAAEIIDSWSDHIVSVPPGKQYKLRIAAKDDRGSIVDTVYLIKARDESSCRVSNSSTYSSSGIVQLEGKQNCEMNIDLQTINNRPISLTFKAIVEECPPGFYFSEGLCKCSVYKSNQEYRGIVKCDDNELVAYMKTGYWAGYEVVRNSTVLVTSDCPPGYCITNKSTPLVPLPSTPNATELDMFICKPQNRMGRLCGECIDGYCISADFLIFRCIKSSPQQVNGVLILILSKYLPLTFFLCIIMFFNISLVNGPLNSFILFSQVLDAMDVYSSGKIANSPNGGKQLVTVCNFLYGIWNLNFLEMLIPPFCIFDSKSALPIITLEYISALHTLIVLVILFIIAPRVKEKLFTSNDRSCCRCRAAVKKCYERYIHLKKSANYRQGESISALTTLLVLCYVKLMAITTEIITPSVLYGPGSKVQISVVWLDGTLGYMDGAHGKYAAVAFICLVTFVLIPPLLLLAYPYLPMLMNKLNVHNKYVEKIFIAPLDKYVPFFDAFQSCYKNEYRFFAALYFIYRIITLCISSQAQSIESQYLGQSIFYTVILLLHCLCQPYKKRWLNIIDGLIFANMIAINSLSAYRYYWYSTNLSKSLEVFWIQLILIFLPVACLAGVVVYILLKRCNWFTRSSTSDVDDTTSLPSRLLDDEDISTHHYQLMDSAAAIVATPDDSSDVTTITTGSSLNPSSYYTT